MSTRFSASYVPLHSWALHGKALSFSSMLLVTLSLSRHWSTPGSEQLLSMIWKPSSQVVEQVPIFSHSVQTPVKKYFRYGKPFWYYLLELPVTFTWCQTTSGCWIYLFHTSGHTIQVKTLVHTWLRAGTCPCLSSLSTTNCTTALNQWPIPPHTLDNFRKSFDGPYL